MKDEKPKRIVRTRGNYVPFRGTTVLGKSMTIQNESQSVADMLRRLAQGQELRSRPGQYVEDADEDDVDVQEYSQMDLAEREHLINNMRQTRATLEALEKEWEAEKVAKTKEKALNQPEKGEKGGETGPKA